VRKMTNEEALSSRGIRYPFERNEDSSFTGDKPEILTRENAEGASQHWSVNHEILKTKHPIVSWDPSTLWLPETQKIRLPERLRRLRAWHPAMEGTAQQYAGRLVQVLPELAGVTDDDIDKALRHVRNKE